MNNESGITAALNTYYGVRETFTHAHGYSLNMITEAYPVKPEDTGEYDNGEYTNTFWFDTKAEAQADYEEGRRESFPEEYEDEYDEEEDEDYDWAEHYRSLKIDAEIKHEIEQRTIWGRKTRWIGEKPRAA